jgi:uncharacterized protein
MKKKYPKVIFFILLLITFKLYAQTPGDIFISEYIEGSAQNKAIELYNGTGSAVDLSTGNYLLQYYFNGASTPGLTITLTGTIANNSVFIVAQSAATFLTTNGGTVTANQISTATNWYNGDDAIVLRKGGASGTIVDAFGQVGFDPGAEWGTGLLSTQDNTLRRKASDCSGDTDASNVFDPSVKFDGFATDDFTGLGNHISSCSVTSSPITVNPASLNFTTTAGTQSAQQSYTVQGNGLTSDITVTIPALSNFGLSLVPGGPYNSSVTIPAASANAGPVTVYIVFTPASAGTQNGNITHVSDATTVNLAVQGIGETAGSFTPVYLIQGTGAASALTGTVVTTEGIVTGDFQGSTQLNGFYIQDTSGDGNSATSDGVFVFNTSFNVNVGDYVRITGTVDEFFNLTEIKTVTALTVLSSGNNLMQPVNINLPVAAITDLENYEGMLVKFPQTLTATETFTLGRFGEVSLSAGGRIFNPTNFVDPNDNPASGTSSSGTSNVAAVTAQQDLNNRSRILLDDGSNVQNPAIVPFFNPADTTLRIGSTLTNLTGVLDFAFSDYRVQPTVTPSFNYAPRPSVPAVGNSNVKIASFNVLNYFNGDGLGGGFPTARGANTLIEFNRQRSKIINAISSLNADAVGLIEIENDGDGPQSAIADIVNGLNAQMGANTYTFIADPVAPNGNTGTDAIKVAIIYKPAVLTPSGASKADISAVHNRPPLAQTFTKNSSSEKFTFIVNHFKSKSCTSAAGSDIDQLDGQGCYNNSRKLQAQALLTFISSLQTASGDADVISVGDYNAYEEEDPMDILKAGGLNNILPGSYSYVFDGQSGSLDHALVTSSLISHVSGAGKWHINSDEPIVKDYNQEFNPAYVYSADAFRSSDHDPVLIGLNLGNAAPSVSITSPVSPATYGAGSTITVDVAAADADGSVSKVEIFVNGNLFATDSVAPYSFTGAQVDGGLYKVTAKATDNAGAFTVSDTLVLNVTECNGGSGSITGEGYTGIPGSQVADLLASPSYPNSPSITASLTSMEYQNVADAYGGRLRGYICAPLTGDYTFYISGDDQAGLWLSTTDNPASKVLIAYTETGTFFRQYYKFASQKSVKIHLVKGGRYYIETLQKESTGGDHLSVAWVLPGGVLEAPIPGSRLSPITVPFAGRPADFTTAMRGMQQSIEAAKKLTVTATPNPSSSYFTLTTRSNSDKALLLKMMDATGRVVESRLNVAANGTLQIGSKLPAGIYFVEVIQGTQKEMVKLLKQ